MNPAPRSTRTRPAKPALSREAVLEAALWLLKHEGVDAMSMRRIAQRLDTGAASLYVYIANRDELYELVFDRMAEEIALPKPNPKRWRENIKDIAWSMVRVFDEYPGSPRLAMSHIPIGPGAMRVTECILANLRAGGVSDQAAAYAMDLLSLYITSIAYEQHVRRESGNLVTEEDFEVYKERVGATFRALPAEQFPHLTALAGPILEGDGEQRFEWGLDILINGLLATPKPGSRR